MYLDVGYTGGLLRKVSSVGFRAVLVWQLKRKLAPTRRGARGRSRRVRVLRVLEVRHRARGQLLGHGDRRVESFLIGRRYRLHLRAPTTRYRPPSLTFFLSLYGYETRVMLPA